MTKTAFLTKIVECQKIAKLAQKVKKFKFFDKKVPKMAKSRPSGQKLDKNLAKNLNFFEFFKFEMAKNLNFWQKRSENIVKMTKNTNLRQKMEHYNAKLVKNCENAEKIKLLIKKKC